MEKRPPTEPPKFTKEELALFNIGQIEMQLRQVAQLARNVEHYLEEATGIRLQKFSFDDDTVVALDKEKKSDV